MIMKKKKKKKNKNFHEKKYNTHIINHTKFKPIFILPTTKQYQKKISGCLCSQNNGPTCRRSYTTTLQSDLK